MPITKLYWHSLLQLNLQVQHNNHFHELALELNLHVPSSFLFLRIFRLFVQFPIIGFGIIGLQLWEFKKRVKYGLGFSI